MYKSALIVAGDKQKHLDKLPLLTSDIAIINLEDGVYDKEKARDLIVGHIQKNLPKNIETKIVIRINSLDSCGYEDIKSINKIKPYAIRVPKVNDKNDLDKAIKESDFDNIKSLSHKLKGVAANLRIEHALDALTNINISEDISQSEIYLECFYKIVQKLSDKEHSDNMVLNFK